MALFADRYDAGRKLAQELGEYREDKEAVVIALPRGGIEIGYEVAKELKLPLEVIVPRKVGAPYQSELAVGAVTEDGTFILNERILSDLGLKEEDVRGTIEEEREEANRRIALYRKGREPYALKDKVLIVVDDGVATGATMMAALASLKNYHAKKIVVAVPVLPHNTLKRVSEESDAVIYLDIPHDFWAVGQFFSDFGQTSDETVVRLLELAHEWS